ncbi:MAG: pyridoxal phosphate-dependent aminotransferase [Enterocloster asparagiformis]|nr:pyridoxal phosphate-dependent aminotransferase [Enterocloster asparagiformis]
MQYNFDEIISRKYTSSLRWDTVEQKYGEPKLIPLTTADMDFKTAPAVIRALREAVDRGIFGYPVPMEGYFEAVIERMERFRGWPVKREWICRSPGVVNGVAYVIQSLTKPGDKIVLPSPMYHPFAHLIEDNGRALSRSSMVLRDGRYDLDLGDLEEKLADSRARLLIFCSPHNPAGRVFTREELEQVIRLCLQHQVLLLCDEIHSDFCFSGHPFVSAGQVARDMGGEYEQNLIVCTSASKSFNIAGLQNSDILIPSPEHRKAYMKVLTDQHLMSCNYLGLLATEAAYRGGQDWLEAVVAYLEENRNYLAEYISKNCKPIHAVVPQATYMAWLDCRDSGMSAARLEQFFIHQARVGVNMGGTFGPEGEGFVRLNFACPRPLLTEALQRISDALDVRTAI